MATKKSAKKSIRSGSNYSQKSSTKSNDTEKQPQKIKIKLLIDSRPEMQAN